MLFCHWFSALCSCPATNVGRVHEPLNETTARASSPRKHTPRNDSNKIHVLVSSPDTATHLCHQIIQRFNRMEESVVRVPTVDQWWRFLAFRLGDGGAAGDVRPERLMGRPSTSSADSELSALGSVALEWRTPRPTDAGAAARAPCHAGPSRGQPQAVGPFI